MIVRVYYADTDAGGVVYYANYLRWFEMDRCELLEELEMPIAEFARLGFLFAVARLEVDYHVSAVLGDELEIQTDVERVRHVRFTLQQRVVRPADGQKIATARVMLACLSPDGKITPLPKQLATALSARIMQ